MMENAGRNLAVQAKHQPGAISENTNIYVIAGNGNNGGGGLVVARHLSNWGANVTVLIVSSENKLKKLQPDNLKL